jgi:transposase-like protein
MKRTLRYFSQAFKEEATRQLEGGKLSAAVIARELGVDASVLRAGRGGRFGGNPRGYRRGKKRFLQKHNT